MVYLERKGVHVFARRQAIGRPAHRHCTSSFCRMGVRKHHLHFIQQLVILDHRLGPLPVRTRRTHQPRPALPFELDDDRVDILAFGRSNHDLAGNNVQVGISHIGRLVQDDTHEHIPERAQRQQEWSFS